jgi:ATP-dependent DNA helicase RecG
MRLDTPLARLAGMTAARGLALAQLGVTRVDDLLRLAPRRYEDRRRATPLAQVAEGPEVLVVARVARSRARRLRGGLSLLEAWLEQDGATLEVRWFLRGFLPSPLPEGARYACYGPVREVRGRPVMWGPERERLDDEAQPEQGLVPVYPLVKGLQAAFVRRLVDQVLPAAAHLPDLVPAALQRAERLPRLADALHDLHRPARPEDAEAARRRLAFDELWLHELALDRRRTRRRSLAATPLHVSSEVHARIRARLPFAPTPAQDKAIDEVLADLARPAPMQRLLQGDVGSGKTLVAAYAILATVAAGRQAAFLAPTDVLARQHEGTLARLLEGSRVRIEALRGGMPRARRTRLLERLASGDVHVLVGTHALLEPDVRFPALGLVVVDEQHKFGVRQRHALLGAAQPGPLPHALLMTATPIPRTLALAVYGDLDVTVLDGLPPGRRPVTTWVVTPRDGAKVMARVKQALAAGEQAFVVYPLVEGGAAASARDATAGAARWQRALPGRRVGLLHGRLAADEKARVLDAFRRRALDVLVATVVVEVGVDVPNASVLVVEHAERFGLTQLHQLRGRVGRGSAASLCVLMNRSGDLAHPRLEVLARTQDGFVVAEEDLAQRGVGDVLGTRQSGAPGWRAARLPADLPLLVRARAAAQALLHSDPGLKRPEHAALAAAVAGLESTPALGG